ncbi:MAG: type II toxin-antitoxin system Phd/YefM family antitoxin [Chloroflexi bacterium]|nr:MAG: type II toxin-antitoxin system Phd/YefM family antitoxin [Chloroflexota bacterium]
MNESQVSIGRVKREISELLNRVAFGGERIVLTSRGKPKAVIVSLDDYEKIQKTDEVSKLRQWEVWLASNKMLTAKMLVERGGEPIDVDAILAEARQELEGRDDYLFDD